MSQLDWYASVLLSVCFMVFAFKFYAQSRLVNIVGESDRVNLLNKVTVYMSLWIFLYLTLHFLRSYVTYKYYFEQTRGCLICSAILDLAGFGMDFYTCVKFNRFFSMMSRKAREGLRRTTCWDRWNQAVIFYGIVVVNFMLALYRMVLQLSFAFWYLEH